MRLNVYASQPGYWRHLDPVVQELRRRGHELETWAYRADQPWGAQLHHVPAGPVLLASWIDAQRWPNSPTVYLEHGAGQTYVGTADRGRGYAGAERLGHVRLFLTPGETVAEQWRATYPAARAVAVGCPALDQHHTNQADPRNEADPSSERSSDEVQEPQDDEHEDDQHQDSEDRHRTTVAVTSHWRCGVCPETMPALPRYEQALRELLETDNICQSYDWVGHAHPRNSQRGRAMFDRLRIPFEVDPDVVLRRLVQNPGRQGSLLVADNTSLLYEAAALGIPVLVLNDPSYRRHVEHGLRFWSHVPGLQCDGPTEFRGMLDAALEDPHWARGLRAHAVAHVYAHLDGRASERAADAIEEAL